MSRLPILLLLLLAAPLALADTPIEGGQSRTLVLEPNSVNTEYYVPVSQDATHLEILLEGKHRKVDVDLYTRFADPFVTATPPAGQLVDGSLYRSVGPNNIEFLELTFASSPPVSPGRWYLALVNLDPEKQTEVTVTVAVRSETEPTLKPLDIEVAYGDGPNFGFNSNAAYTPQGGNNAATLGDARKAALRRAIEILEESFTSPVPIVIEVVFEDIEDDDDDENTGTLAFAGPNCVARDFPGAPVANTWYAQPIVPRLAGTDFFRAGFRGLGAPDDQAAAGCFRQFEADLKATFNTSPPGDWWYGLEPAQQVQQGFDFVSVALHEILHGLGYLSLVDVETGEKFQPPDSGEPPRNDIFTEQLFTERNNGNFVAVNKLGDKARLNAFTSNGNLHWLGEQGDTVFWPENRAALNQTRVPHPFMYSPGSPNPGSSVSHTFFKDIMYYQGSQAGATNQTVDLRGSGPGLGSAYYFLRDAGWGEEPKAKLEGPVTEAIPRGLWYDRVRSGHGFELQRIGDAWFLLFFTYDAEGNPEWYLAEGTVEDNVFNGVLYSYVYDESDPDGDNTNVDATEVGTVELAFGATAESAACDDGVDREGAVALARFTWSFESGGQGDWCLEPLGLPGVPPVPDFSGSWYAGPTDTGWGMTIYLRENDDGSQVLVDTLYYYDDEGNPRWAQGVEQNFLNNHGGQTIDMRQFEGYPRNADCAPEICSAGEGTSAGVLRLKLAQPLQGEDPASRATTNVEYLGPEGGRWQKNFVPIQLLSDPS